MLSRFWPGQIARGGRSRHMRELILLFFVALSVPLVIKRPVIGMVIYLAINIIRPEMLFWGGGTGAFVFKFYYGLVIVAAICQGYLANMEKVLRMESLMMVWLLCAVFASIQFTQVSVAIADYYALEMLKTFGICLLIYLLVDEFSNIRTIQNILLGCFTLLGLWGIEQQFRGNARLEGLGGNSWGDSNGVAAIFVMFLPVAFAKLFTSNGRREFWSATAIVAVMVALIVCTKSRGGLVGLVVAVFAYGFYSRNMKKIAVVALLMAVVALPFASKPYLDRMKTMKSSDALDDSANSRFILWKAGLLVFADNPIFGTGFLTFPEAKMKYERNFAELDDDFRAWVFREDNKKVPHNTYIQMMSECGLFGIIPFMALIAGGIYSGIRSRALLLRLPHKNEQLIWLCGLSAGITGYSVCILAIDAALVLFLYVQLAFIGILYRMLMRHEGSVAALQVLSVGENADG